MYISRELRSAAALEGEFKKCECSKKQTPRLVQKQPGQNRVRSHISTNL